ncbi:beta-ketoacyl-ACP synthase III [uncultured Pseudoteredinibacter sp.]|uniref:beta-ketoacyl-ACP synthase III n=1 Tax=uncultured Pseudoteredinibacter sp. TaxID=1641701 RepID=UPI002620E6DC|nr:beta-ketoacyl-ACP synthase III [uncultured Pseudoteredinibacter sp.]
MNKNIVISGTGLYAPPNSVSNEELVEALNAHADKYNEENAAAIEAGELTAKAKSSAEFIEKASGIKSRYVYRKEGILDVDRLCPVIPLKAEDETSDQALMAIEAAKEAMAAANKTAADIDAVIVSCAYTQRSYPAIAIEVQTALGIEGFGFDMLVACSAATFALQRAYEMVTAGTARAVLCINPELTTPQIDYSDRDSHFIFGDVATATIVEAEDTANSENCWDVLSTKAFTSFSNNIRSSFGHAARANDVDPFWKENLFHQNGRKVFKEVCPMAAEHISEHLSRHDLTSADVKRWWLHQANINMNLLISKKLLGRDASLEEAPIVLDEFANTASAGSLIAFHKYSQDLAAGDHGVICSFGAGYSIGSLVIRKR